jgi:hypothetical protein
MEQSRPSSKTISHSANSLSRRLDLYALAAGAAGVGIVALAEPAHSQIVYTPAQSRIYWNEVVPLDLNHDGQEDFLFSNVAKAGHGYKLDQLTVIPSGMNQILVLGHTTSALPAGVNVGPVASFSGDSRLMVFADAALDTSDVCRGQWKNANPRYLGLRFSIDGEAHFGWARLNAECRGYEANAVLTGYAYETVAGKAIVTGQTQETKAVSSSPEPASLGALAASLPRR